MCWIVKKSPRLALGARQIVKIVRLNVGTKPCITLNEIEVGLKQDEGSDGVKR